MGFGILVFLSIAALVGAIFYFSWLYERKRCKAIETVAQQMGLSFTPSGEDQLPARIREFNLFNQGRDRRLTNLLWGETDEVAIFIFDYQYTIGSGKSSHTHRMTVAALSSPTLTVPPFTMRPEGFFDRFGTLLGLQDINFPEHPGFSKMFVLKGPDEDAIRACFKPKVLEMFAAMGRISVEALPERMIFYRGSKRVPPTEIPKLLEEAYRVFGVLVD